MRIREGSMSGLLLIEADPIIDERGYFVRVLAADLFAEAGIDHSRFVQENQSRSRGRTIRGLHLRATPSEAKLVRCVHGAIFDVAVDVRPWSPTFGQWERFILDDTQHLQVYIPAGFAHGFQALSDEVDVCYRIDQTYDPTLEAAISWNDPDIDIPWPLADPIISARDRSAPSFKEMGSRLEEWFGTTPP